MKISPVVVGGVEVDVVHYLTNFGPSHLPVFPLSATSLRSISVAMRAKSLFVRSVGSFGLCRGWLCDWHFRDWTLHQIPSPVMLACWQTMYFCLIGIKWIVMAVPHLVVAHAHFAGRNRTGTVQASPADNSASPSILRGPVLLLALVVHQAQTERSVRSAAALNGALSVKSRWCHHGLPFSRLRSTQYKTYGNSMAVLCMRWLGCRIELALRGGS